jgi:uncharacterized protein (TIGR02996 family)
VAKRQQQRAPARDAALEQRIVDAPDDDAARMVYGDWLQSRGDPLGDWVALSGDDGYLASHLDELLGAGALLWPGSHVTWRRGFIDELRMQRAVDPARRARALFARPIARFVRRLAIAPMPKLEGVIEAVVAAAPPLLSELLVSDGSGEHAVPAVDALADLPSLRALTLYGASLTRALPQLRELAIAVPSTVVPWLVGGGAPNVEALTLFCGTRPAPLAPVFAALPDLRALCVIGAPREVVEAQVGDLAGQLARIETADSLESWVVQRVRARGRDEVALLPFAGLHLVNAGERLLHAERPREALPLLDAAITLPSRAGLRAWVGAALANLAAGLWERALAVARAGLMRHPREPMLLAVIVDAHRGAGRFAEALAAVPAALDAVEARSGHYEGGAAWSIDACARAVTAAGDTADARALAQRLGPRQVTAAGSP